MTRKTKTKKKAEPKPRQKTEIKQDDTGNETTLGESNDYGGMPDRDLKKNLGGCG
jgi:hypothetical protein